MTAPLRVDVPATASLATVCDGWAREGRGAPQRIAAFWPGRFWPARSGPEASSTTLCVLADDPPIVWWGWSDRNHGYDILQWPNLAGRVRRFLETLPLDAPQGP